MEKRGSGDSYGQERLIHSIKHIKLLPFVTKHRTEIKPIETQIYSAILVLTM